MIGTVPPPRATRPGSLIAGNDTRFADRAIAGRLLAQQLRAYRGDRVLVLALPPGGVAVAGELARTLRLPLDVLVARTFAVPDAPDSVVGALSEGGGLCFNRAALRLPGVTLSGVWRAARQARRDVLALVAAYRGARPLPLLQRRSIILVDDGLGSGLPQLAAFQALRRAHGHRVIIATPWATEAAMQRVRQRVDGLIALAHTADPQAASAAHWDHPLDDDMAAALLKRYRGHIALI